MTREEKLEALVRRAVDNGFALTLPMPIDQEFLKPELVPYVIFNHSFARALWGDNDDDRIPIIWETDWRKWPLPWQHHLQQAVISKDPIDYMYQAVFG